MRFTIEQRYRAPLAAVEAAYCAPSLYAALAGLPKLGGATLLDQTVEDERVTQRVRYHFTGELNAAVTAVVDADKLSWVEESVYDRTVHEKTWRIVPDHYGSRLRCEGVSRLAADAADADATRRITDAQIKVHFPLVGGRVERAIVSGLEEHAAAEQVAVESYLDGLEH